MNELTNEGTDQLLNENIPVSCTDSVSFRTRIIRRIGILYIVFRAQCSCLLATAVRLPPCRPFSNRKQYDRRANVLLNGINLPFGNYFRSTEHNLISFYLNVEHLQFHSGGDIRWTFVVPYIYNACCRERKRRPDT